MGENPTQHLYDASEGVRSFNHASYRPSDEWTFPNHSYKALGALSELTGMLEQAIEQATRPVMRTYEHGRVLIDGNGDADAKVAELVNAREEAVQAAAALTAVVRRMHSTTSPMGLDIEGIPEFQDDEPHRD